MIHLEKYAFCANNYLLCNRMFVHNAQLHAAKVMQYGKFEIYIEKCLKISGICAKI